MKSLLNALENGRLTELPAASTKDQALELLALLIEAVPAIGNKMDLVKGVKEREVSANTAIGRGVAVPHCRGQAEGELLCAVGWSPEGIDYGASDGEKVRLLVMYCVPDSKRGDYLKEISSLARALGSSDEVAKLSGQRDIHGLRDTLLDWVTLSIQDALPEAKARMIKLEARQAIVSGAQAAVPVSASRILPFRLVSWEGGEVALCLDPELARSLEAAPGLAAKMSAAHDFEESGWRIAVLSVSAYANGKNEYEAVALKLD
jgi:PTS system nitrogen regulatory IIA component